MNDAERAALYEAAAKVRREEEAARTAPPPRFGGETYDPERDGSRLKKQLSDVTRVMRDGEWHTLDAISLATGHPQASVSARLRDLRKPQFGSHEVDREYVSKGLWRYRLRMQLR